MDSFPPSNLFYCRLWHHAFRRMFIQIGTLISPCGEQAALGV
jgi:hypothetical protein